MWGSGKPGKAFSGAQSPSLPHPTSDAAVRTPEGAEEQVMGGP